MCFLLPRLPLRLQPDLDQRSDLIVEAMSTGLSAEAAAAKVGISARSLFYWQRQHPEFLQAIQEGRQKCLLYWEERAIAVANGEPGNTRIVMLALKKRSGAAHGWSNQLLQVQHSLEVQPVEPPLNVSRLDEEERWTLRALLRKLLLLSMIDEAISRPGWNGPAGSAPLRDFRYLCAT